MFKWKRSVVALVPGGPGVKPRTLGPSFPVNELTKLDLDFETNFSDLDSNQSPSFPYLI